MHWQLRPSHTQAFLGTACFWSWEERKQILICEIVSEWAFSVYVQFERLQVFSIYVVNERYQVLGNYVLKEHHPVLDKYVVNERKQIFSNCVINERHQVLVAI